MHMYYCPCCGYRTLSEERGFSVCEVCFWEDDPLQYDDPDFRGGANRESLRQYQEAFEKGFIVGERLPWREEDRNPAWKMTAQYTERHYYYM